MQRIITVTLNPSVDKTAETEGIEIEGLNRLEKVELDAGGKGVNVSKMIAALGGVSIATGFVGGSTGVEIEKTLQKQMIETDFVHVSGTTRTNLKIISQDGGLTEFNEPGMFISETEMSGLIDKLSEYARPETTIVFAGSLPLGVETTTYKRLIQVVKSRGASVFLDADGEAFKHAIEAKPDYIKPNLFEFYQHFRGQPLETIYDHARLCRKLVDEGIKLVVLSMGADGALFVSENECFIAEGLKVKVLSSVGAGDSMVGALVYGFSKAMSLCQSAELAMACSAGAVTTIGTKPPKQDIVEKLLKQVVIKTLGEV